MSQYIGHLIAGPSKKNQQTIAKGMIAQHSQMEENTFQVFVVAGKWGTIMQTTAISKFPSPGPLGLCAEGAKRKNLYVPTGLPYDELSKPTCMGACEGDASLLLVVVSYWVEKATMCEGRRQ